MIKRSSKFTTDRPTAIRKDEHFGSRGKPDHTLDRGAIRDSHPARQAITRHLSPAQADHSLANAPRADPKEGRGRRVGRDSPLQKPATSVSPPLAESAPHGSNLATRRTGQNSWQLTSAATLGELVREQRQNLGFSQQRLADLAGVGRRFVSELENGKPSLEFERVLTCCAALGIDLFARSRS